jgi:hypothetical protein
MFFEIIGTAGSLILIIFELLGTNSSLIIKFIFKKIRIASYLQNQIPTQHWTQLVKLSRKLGKFKNITLDFIKIEDDNQKAG